MKNEKLVKTIFLIMLIICIFVLSNSVITNGHDVILDDKIDSSYIINHVGYLQENSTFTPAEDEHYITFYQNPCCSEFSLILEEAPKSDLDVEVWLMSDTGDILRHNMVKWLHGKYIFRVEDIDSDMRFVSLRIDNTFTIRRFFESNPYHSRKVQMILFFILSAFTAAVMYFIPSHKLYNKIYKPATEILKRAKDNPTFFIRNIIIVVLPLTISIGVAILAGFGLSQAGLTFNNYPISLNYRFVILLSVLLTYSSLTIIYRKYILKHFPFFTFLTIMLVGAAFVLTESCSVGISWDDQIHYHWVNYLSHFVDRKRTYAEWEMIDSYARYPWYKDKVPEFYSYFDEYYKEGYFYRFEDYKFPFGKIVYLPMVLGFMFSRGLGLEFHRGFYFARLFEVAFAAILAALSVKRLRKGRIVILLIALIPTNIFITSNLSYDTWVTSWSILGFSFLFAEMQEPKKSITTARMLVIPLAFFLAAIYKQIYFALAIPALFLSAKKFSDKTFLIGGKFDKPKKEIKLSGKYYKWIYRFLVILSMILPFVLMLISNILNAGSGDWRGGSEVNSANQITYILNNMPAYLVTLFKFLSRYLNIFRKDISPFDLYGYEGVAGINILIVIILLFGAFVDHSSKRGAFPWWFRIGILILYAGIGALCATALYISFTAVGADYIAGCQQRYLLPAIFPTIYVLSRIPRKCKVRKLIGTGNIYAILSILMVILDIYGMYRNIVVYY